MGSDKVRRLTQIYMKIQQDPGYRNDRMGTVFVPGAGHADSPLVLIGEAPGREEELLRRPFVGAAGRNLDRLLHDIGLSREQVFISNLLKYRPLDAKGGNRKPSRQESRYALPYLIEELAALAPRLVVCLGSSAAAMLLDEPYLNMNRANGALFEKQGMKILVTYHPSPFNYSNPKKREALHRAFAHLRDIVGTF
jgi:DNA polymerase